MRNTLDIQLQPYSYDNFRQSVWECSKDLTAQALAIKGGADILIRFVIPNLDQTVIGAVQLQAALYQLQTYSTQLTRKKFQHA